MDLAKKKLGVLLSTGLDHANLVEEHLVELDDECSAQARFDEVSDAIVGFHWSWT